MGRRLKSVDWYRREEFGGSKVRGTKEREVL